MATDSMEQLVRFRFMQREQGRMNDYITQHPEFNEAITRTHQQYEDTVLENMLRSADDTFDEDDIEEIKANVLDPMMAVFKAQFTVDKMSNSVGQAYLKDTDTLKKELEEAYAKAQEDKDSPLDFSELKNQTLRAIEYAKSQDVLIARLTDYAKEKGIDAAMEDEAVYNVTRGLFPTREAYEQHLAKGKEIVKNIFSSFGSIFAGLCEEDEDLGNVVTSIFKSLDVYIPVFLEHMGKMDREKMDKVYGPDKKY